jgi:hypothetical protein
VFDLAAFQTVLMVLTGWLENREREVIACLVEENRLLRRQLGRRRVRLGHDDRRRLAVRAHRLGRRALRDVATIVTPDTLLRWHRQLVARTWPRRVHAVASDSASAQAVGFLDGVELTHHEPGGL